MMQPELPWSIYIRTSTFEQGEKSSPLKQFLACVAWAKSNGKTIPGIESAVVGNKVRPSEHIFIDHQTGTNDDRPDLQRFMARAKSGKVGGVVCYVVDRAARNLSDALKIQRELKTMRVGFQFALQNFDDTPGGTMMFQIFAAFAEYEVKIIAERTSDGRKKRVLGQGKKDSKPRLQGPAIYGYHLEDGIPVEDEKEGPIARLYLRLALESSTSSYEIAKILNKAGHRTRAGLPWRAETVSRNLRRAHCYAGVYQHQHGIEAAIKAHREAVKLMGSDAPALDLAAIETIKIEAYPPFISREEANLILARVQKNREKRGQPTKRYALSHYLWCEACGTRWYADGGFYRCGCTRLGRPRCKAKAHWVAQEQMESAVIDGMRAYLKRPEVHYALALADYKASQKSSMRSRSDIEKQIRAMSKEKAHYDEKATEYGLSRQQQEIAKKKAHDLELKIAEMSAELRQSSVVPLPSESGIVAAFRQILGILDRITTFAEKRAFVEAIIERILTDGQQVRVMGEFDLEAVENKGSQGNSYSNRHQDAGLNNSAPIPFNFSVPIERPNRAVKGWETRRKKRVA